MSSPKKQDPIQIAQYEGQAARRIKVPIEHNPYESGTDQYEAWERGWNLENEQAAQPC